MTPFPVPARRSRFALCVAVALCAAAGGCQRTPSGGVANHKSETARRQATASSVDAAKGAAEALAAADPTAVPKPAGPVAWVKRHLPGHGPTVPTSVAVPASEPTPVYPWERTVTDRSTVSVTARSGVPHPTEAEAEEDALQVARDRLAERLAELTPPVRHVPPPTAIKERYVRKASRAVREPNADERAALDKAGVTAGGLRYVEFTVDVTADQLRELRSRDRLSAGLRGVGGLLVVCLAGFLFLRADEWSRGYLTSWLGLLAGLFVAVGVLVALTVRGGEWVGW